MLDDVAPPAGRSSIDRETVGRVHRALPVKADMHIAAIRVELRIRDSHSLKNKRRVVKSILAEFGKAHPVAIAEVDHQDLWQRASIGIAVVSSSPGQVDRMLRAIRRDIEAWNGVELLEVSTSYLEAVEP